MAGMIGYKTGIVNRPGGRPGRAIPAPSGPRAVRSPPGEYSLASCHGYWSLPGSGTNGRGPRAAGGPGPHPLIKLAPVTVSDCLTLRLGLEVHRRLELGP
jgi:hypothetical protein